MKNSHYKKNRTENLNELKTKKKITSSLRNETKYKQGKEKQFKHIGNCLKKKEVYK
jgi:hypothetical protein